MDNKLCNSERFINTYNRLDKHMRRYSDKDYYESHTSLIDTMVGKGDVLFKRHSEILKQFAKLRNAIVHNPKDNDSRTIAEPHDIVVKKYEEFLEQVINPPLAINSMSIPNGKIYKTSLNSNAFEVIDIMKENMYSHVPVIENNKLVGIFSENAVFSYIAQKHLIKIEESTKISEFREFIPIDRHTSERFIFVNRETSVIEIDDIFQDEYKDEKRLGAVFITENGKDNEKILGLITPWDIASYSGY